MLLIIKEYVKTQPAYCRLITTFNVPYQYLPNNTQKYNYLEIQQPHGRYTGNTHTV